MARHTARRILLAPITDVWAFLADPYNLADWWPGVSGVEPDRRGLAPGARWKVIGPDEPSYFRKPQMSGTLLVLEVVPQERLVFQLSGDRMDVELRLQPVDEHRTEIDLAVEAPFMAMRRRFPVQALAKLHSLLRSGEAG